MVQRTVWPVLHKEEESLKTREKRENEKKHRGLGTGFMVEKIEETRTRRNIGAWPAHVGTDPLDSSLAMLTHMS